MLVSSILSLSFDVDMVATPCAINEMCKQNENELFTTTMVLVLVLVLEQRNAEATEDSAFLLYVYLASGNLSILYATTLYTT